MQYRTITQEGRAITGNHCTIQGTCTESLHLILGQYSEQKEYKLWANIGKLSKKYFTSVSVKD